LLVPVVLILIYIANVVIGLRSGAQVDGTISGVRVLAPVQIMRDARGIPHIRAQNEHDAFFAQGYVEAQDRLWQMDLIRRFVYGELSEIFGKSALKADQDARNVPVRQIVAKQWQVLPARERATLQAYSDGVNAAMAREPAPVEFRILLYNPQPWTPQDSLAAGMATVLDLTDDWNDIAPRDKVYRRRGMTPDIFAKLYPLTDPCYDAPVLMGFSGIVNTAACIGIARASRQGLTPEHKSIGSNAWAAGAARTSTGRSLLASDPHLRLRIPGAWYLVDVQAPGFHVAGASLAGTPGVILGHNDRVAWAATNGTVASLSVFGPLSQLNNRFWQAETFHARFGGDVQQRYYRTPSEFDATIHDGRHVLVRWDAYRRPRSPIETFTTFNRSRSIEDTLRGLRAYPGPTQNFVLADTSGRVAYQLAGVIPNDPAWARYFHPARDLAQAYSAVPFDRLPALAPSRDAIVWTANNKMYPLGYPLRLSPAFEPPYRAHRVAQLLHTRSRYDVAYFARMQLDVQSDAELELARKFAYRVLGLKSWDGRVLPDSVAATQAVAFRQLLVATDRTSFGSALQRNRAAAGMIDAHHFAKETQPWREYGAVPVPHALALLGIHFLDGVTLPGNGDGYTIHMQKPGYSQSFRSVWDVGNWDAGGISIPEGESGRPGSGHYTDLAADWIAGRLVPLPFTSRAVTAATRNTLVLKP
jgi:penicillin G amidase